MKKHKGIIAKKERITLFLLFVSTPWSHIPFKREILQKGIVFPHSILGFLNTNPAANHNWQCNPKAIAILGNKKGNVEIFLITFLCHSRASFITMLNVNP